MHEKHLSSARPCKAEVTAVGGVGGFVQSSDSRLRLELSGPSAQTDGSAKGTSPEQLLAAAYAACFLAAIREAGREAELAIAADANVTARIDVEADDDAGGGAAVLGITLIVDLPGIDEERRGALVKRAHAISRCSRALRGDLRVRTIAD